MREYDLKKETVVFTLGGFNIKIFYSRNKIIHCTFCFFIEKKKIEPGQFPVKFGLKFHRLFFVLVAFHFRLIRASYEVCLFNGNEKIVFSTASYFSSLINHLACRLVLSNYVRV